MVKTRRRVPKRKTQKMWNMVGCSKHNKKMMGGNQMGGGCGCGIQFGGGQKGGGCGCGLQFGGKHKKRGGGSLSLSPSPFVNKPWFAPISSWPGVQGSGTGNWLTKNQMNVDLSERTGVQERGGSISPFQMGGKRKKSGSKKKRKQHGGFLSDLVNAGRSLSYGLNNAYSNLIGSPNMPVNPMPTVQFPYRSG